MSGLIGGVGSKSGTIGSTEIPGGYEEGEWTATFAATTSGSVTINTGVDTCSYTKIGRVVHIQGYLGISSASSPVGHLKLLGLPFTVATGRTELQEYSAISIYYGSLGNDVTWISAVTEPNSTYLYVWKMGARGSEAFAGDVEASSILVFGGCYEV